jgi:hypothetical protein
MQGREGQFPASTPAGATRQPHCVTAYTTPTERPGSLLITGNDQCASIPE